MAFKWDLGVYGLWLGFSIACIILDAGFLLIIECPDWQKLADKMQATIDMETLKKIIDKPDDVTDADMAKVNPKSPAQGYMHSNTMQRRKKAAVG